MARPLRLEFPGGLYHVTARGDRRENIYEDDSDREAFLALVARVCDRFHWRCHAYCLMTNHYHLIVETPVANLSNGMRQLNGVYTQQFNRRYKRVGHVFQGRYKAIIVDKDSYLLGLSRYVVLNPVRAKMIKNVKAWPWSSYRSMVGVATAPDWLETDFVLSQFGKQRKRAQQRYAEFVRQGVGQASIWSQLQAQVFLGSEPFVKKMQAKLERKVSDIEIPKVQRRSAPMPLDAYEKQFKTRGQVMYEAYRSGHYTMKALADYFGVHYATVSRAVKKIENGL
jgi:REP element-mobilizing transposase RayT/transposase